MRLLTLSALGSAVFASSMMLAGTAQAENIPPEVSEFLDYYWSEEPRSKWECKWMFGSSPFQMARCMTADNVMDTLEEFQEIADENQGNRAAGLPGYDESVAFIVDELEDMGYDVTLDAFDFNAFYENADGVLSDGTTTYEFGVDFTYMSQTEPGNVSSIVEAVDLDLGLDNASSSGCEPEDFSGFTAGNIALVQRGACAFQTKAENAAAAGAVGVIIFNQGNAEGRFDLIRGTLGSGYSGGIPVFFATYDLGEQWAGTADLTMSMVADVIRETRTVENVIAQTKRGNPDNVVMVGAHLDSVFEGPGVQDNGSGSAAILELARLMRKTHVNNAVRFAWWGAEEAGLVGSTLYVQNLPEEELAKIKVYLNFDMIASPNFFYGIYDGDGSDFGLEGPAGSKATEKAFETYFALRGQPSEGSEISFRSDYAEFFLQDVAFGGLFTGAEVIKTEEQAAIYGGDAGIAFDPCYHAECDTIDNIAERALEVNSDAAAFVTSWFARSTKEIDDEIAAAQEPAAPQMMMMQSAASAAFKYDITHWGKYWIK